MFARVNYFKEPPENIDEANRVTEEKLVPQVRAQPGFLGLHVLVDRLEGRSIAITYWETAEAMRASEQVANRIRQEGNELTGSETLNVERYEVALRVGF